MRVFAPAKVNLHLAVGAVRPDGYHDVTTVLHALAFGDTVVITPAGSFGFSCAPELGIPAEDNLACRAARAMAERFGRPLDVSIVVEKRIPAGAGLGGASADAAATITGLASLWGIAPDDAALAEVAAGLGADVPFFLTGGAALFGGRGDVLERRLPALRVPVALAKPTAPVLTGAAYAAFDRAQPMPVPGPDVLMEAIEAGDVSRATAQVYNNMTEASIGLVPEIAGAMRLFAESHGVLSTGMAGSGSAVFGLFADEHSAEHAAASARDAGLWGIATRTYEGGCRIE